MKWTLYSLIGLLAFFTAGCQRPAEDRPLYSEQEPDAPLEPFARERPQLYPESEQPGVVGRDAMTGRDLAQFGDQTVTGEIVEVDPAAGTVTIQQTFRITESTQTEDLQGVQGLAGTTGQRATIHYQDAPGALHDEPLALRIEIQSDAMEAPTGVQPPSDAGPSTLDREQ